MAKWTFTSESVTEGHPDKMADQISDSVLDALLEQDPDSRVACETMVTTGLAIVAGEISTKAYVDIQSIVRQTIRDIGYDREDVGYDGSTCGVLVAIDEQSVDIAQGVDDSEEVRSGTSGEEDQLDQQGAGDQGMMFGYASSETENYMPVAIDLAHRILRELADIRREGKLMTYLRPDAKSQVTIEYDDNHKPTRIDTIVVSTQHDDFDTDASMLAKIRADVLNILIPRMREKCQPIVQALFNEDITYHVNPTGKFVIGGPHGDSGRVALYDGIRQLLFVVPILMVAAAWTGVQLVTHLTSARWRGAAVALAALLSLDPLLGLIRLHPYQYIFFNRFAGGLQGAAGRFEADYWGLALRETAEWVNRNRSLLKSRGLLKVFVPHNCAEPSSAGHYLDPAVLLTDNDLAANYVLAPTRFGCDRQFDGTPVFRVQREGVTLAVVKVME